MKIEEYKFSDLVDIQAFERIMNSMFLATKIPIGLVADDGKILSEIGWVSACANFHRVNPMTNAYCQESNLALMQNLQDEKIACATCKNGLLDYATPIVIEGRRVATIFLGQVFTEAPDKEFFKRHAKSVGFDEVSYLKAIAEVPIVSKEQMEALMDCMVGMAEMLASSALARVREKLMQDNLHESREKSIELEDILNLSPVGVGWSNPEGNIEYLNRRFTELFGYTIDDVPNLETWYEKAYPDAEYRNSIIEPWKKEVMLCREKNIEPPEIEANIVCKDGNRRHVFIRVSWVGEKRLVNFSDMTAHWRSEQRNIAHDSILEMVAKGFELKEILNSIVTIIEEEDNSSLCSILLLDKDKKHLHNGVAPHLPEFYNEAIEGIEIGVGVGSCGTAAYLGERVVVEDIMTHEYWAPYTELAKSAGLGACWSEPILATNRDVLGTFAIYHATRSTPTPEDLERIKFAANIAAIAIENKDAHEELEQQAYSDYLTGLTNRRAFIDKAKEILLRRKRYNEKLSLMMFDIDYFKHINDTYGHAVGDLVLQKIGDISRKTLRDVDIIGRIGGEEFAVLMPQTDMNEALNAAERLRMAFINNPVLLSENESIEFTASFGVVAVNNETNSIDTILNQVDNALYDAKKSGRNRVCSKSEIKAK